MAIARENSSELLAVLLIVLVGALFLPGIRVSYFSRGNTNQGFVAQSGIQPDFSMQIQPSQFLMRNGTSAGMGITFTPFNGFVGNVTLSAIVSPVVLSTPTVSFNPSTVKLNASLPGSPSYQILLNTTRITESGLYTVTVTGSSSSVTHSATGTVGVTSVFVPANGADLVYKAYFMSVAFVGGSTALNSTFEDLGYVPIGITNLTVSLGFRTFQGPQSCSSGSPPGLTICVPLYVNPYKEKSTALAIQIPDNLSAGNYTVTVTVSWVLNPVTLFERSAPDLIAHGYLKVYPIAPPSNPPDSPPSLPPSSLSVPSNNGVSKVLLPILGGGIAIVVLIVGLAVRNERKKQVTFDRLPNATLFCARCGTPVVLGIGICAQCGHEVF